MSYYIATTLDEPFETAIAHAEEALKKEGFGIISRIDIQDALNTKIGVEFRPYTILGACNPALAHEALKLEDKVGTMLPCNVVVQARDGATKLQRSILLLPCRPSRIPSCSRQHRRYEIAFSA